MTLQGNAMLVNQKTMQSFSTMYGFLIGKCGISPAKFSFVVYHSNSIHGIILFKHDVTLHCKIRELYQDVYSGSPFRTE